MAGYLPPRPVVHRSGGGAGPLRGLRSHPSGAGPRLQQRPGSLTGGGSFFLALVLVPGELGLELRDRLLVIPLVLKIRPQDLRVDLPVPG